MRSESISSISFCRAGLTTIFFLFFILASSLMDVHAAQKGNQQIKSLIFGEELSIGVREGDDHYMFGNSIMVNADDAGNIYVTDWDKKLIRKYDRNGKYLLTIGRPGQGPGEFSNISVARFDKAGNIYVLDFAARKIVFFDPNGKYLNQKVFLSGFVDLRITPAGTYLGIQSRWSEISGIKQLAEIRGIFDSRFELLTELRATSAPIPRPPKMDPKGRAEEISQYIFQPEALYALDDDGIIYFGYSAKYSIGVYSAEGKKLRTISRDGDPPKSDKQDRDDFFEYEWDDYSRYIPPATKDQMKKFIQFPYFKPYFERLVPLENGWLAVVVDSERNRTVLLDLFDQEGRFLDRVKAAVPMTNLFFKNGKAYAVKSDMGYLFVKRYSFDIR